MDPKLPADGSLALSIMKRYWFNVSECATKETQTHHYIIQLASYSVLEDCIWSFKACLQRIWIISVWSLWWDLIDIYSLYSYTFPYSLTCFTSFYKLLLHFSKVVIYNYINNYTYSKFLFYRILHILQNLKLHLYFLRLYLFIIIQKEVTVYM